MAGQRNDARPFSSSRKQQTLGLRNFQVFADFLGEEVVNLSMAGYCGCLSSGTIDVDAMTSAFTEELNTVPFKVADQVDPLHEIEAIGSRITVLF